MPEGDTILRAAKTLSRALGGKRVVQWRSPLATLRDANLAGRTITGVESRGKHLLILFDDGRALHSHMQMTGSWHIYRPGESWQKPERLARVILETEDFVAICFNAPVVELLTPAGLARHPGLSRLGPDVLDVDFDLSEARGRLRATPDAPIGEALLSQRALAGIGNIYKSESLFAARTDPFVPVARLSDDQIDHVVRAARRLMSANVDPGVRTRTTRGRDALGGPRYAVYRRSGLPCLSCGTRIRMRRQGDAGRSTYWCPACQMTGDRSQVTGDR